VLIVVGFVIFGIIAPQVNAALDHQMVATGTTLIAQPAFAGENFEAKIAKAQNIVIDEIASCETPGIKEPDAAIVLDSNNEMSIGSWQWQIKSIQHYVKERDGRDITRVEAINLATNHEQARELVRYVLFTDSAWDNWLNCSTKLDIGTQVELINKIAN
jgi:hypothetical protein